MENKTVEINTAVCTEDFYIAKELILEYVSWLGIDLSFQNFDDEINDLREMYSNPTGGLLIARTHDKAIGVAGIRRFSGNECEIKRMFVKIEYRGLGIGKLLLNRCIKLAKELGYGIIKLDTADFMKSAIKLYTDHGFVEIPAYRYNPHREARYFELVIK